jgi:hypothetical protein
MDGRVAEKFSQIEVIGIVVGGPECILKYGRSLHALLQNIEISIRVKEMKFIYHIG